MSDKEKTVLKDRIEPLKREWVGVHVKIAEKLNEIVEIINEHDRVLFDLQLGLEEIKSLLSPGEDEEEVEFEDGIPLEPAPRTKVN